MEVEIDHPIDKEGIIKSAITLFEIWKECNECQYNCYICSYHLEAVEPILKKIAPLYDMIVSDFQAVTREEYESWQ